ncbi:MAG: hypothetical protein AMXMBFR44_5590 [Candidatus Campbellbacteria bacterium]
MVKRVSILYNTELRAELKRNPRFGESRGLEDALRAVHAINILIFNEFARFDWCGRSLIRCLEMGTTARDDLQRALGNGSRATAVIGRAVFSYIRVELNIYANGMGQPIGRVVLNFEETDGRLAAESHAFRK